MGKITFDYSKTAGFISEEEIGYMSTPAYFYFPPRFL